MAKKKQNQSKQNPLNIPVYPSVAEQLKSVPKKSETEKPKTNTGNVEVFKDQNNQLSGFTLNGETYFGATPEEIRGVVEKQRLKTEIPTGAALVGTQRALEQQQEQGALLAQRVGMLSPDIVRQGNKASGIDYGQVIGGGLAAAAPGVTGGAAVGAAGGSLAGGVGAVPGAIGGAILGGVGAFVAGARSNLKAQRSGSVQASAASLPDAEKNLRKFIIAANQNPAAAAEYNAMFNEQLSYIERDWGKLQLDSSGFLKDLSGVDGTPQRADYQRFYDTTRPLLIQQMQLALLNPDPNKNLLNPEDLE